MLFSDTWMGNSHSCSVCGSTDVRLSCDFTLTQSAAEVFWSIYADIQMKHKLKCLESLICPNTADSVACLMSASGMSSHGAVGADADCYDLSPPQGVLTDQ